MVPEQAERLVIGVRGKGGARRAGLLAPDLLAVGGVDLLGLVAQDRDFLLREAAGQEQIAFFSELPKLLRRQRHRGLLPMTMDDWLSRRAVSAPARSAWCSRRTLGACGIAGKNEPKDLPVLGPHQRALLGIVEHSAHRAFQMRPLRRDSIFDRAVAGQTVERGVKRDVGLDERQDRGIRPQREACCECPLRGPPLRQFDHPPRDALGGEPRGQRVERRADLVKLANLVGVDPETISPRRPFSSTSFCCLSNCSAWLIGCRETPSSRPSSSWRMRCPGASVPSAIASTNCS